ncbi:uncharacterized protein EAF02_005420 [Botrytis sinoallii]|uniref:uncharacterized protein n=1 Tax=Botrytis sinoallii TaxID=1463999 RepID=UPI0019012107|nr:uncharacterized protein EAF02_005420 [Botrytis sinoallii]KAF7883500.1 hypothetical protein EAF02_005420 [Botrytis sinoallii]
MHFIAFSLERFPRGYYHPEISNLIKACLEAIPNAWKDLASMGPLCGKNSTSVGIFDPVNSHIFDHPYGSSAHCIFGSTLQPGFCSFLYRNYMGFRTILGADSCIAGCRTRRESVVRWYFFSCDDHKAEILRKFCHKMNLNGLLVMTAEGTMEGDAIFYLAGCKHQVVLRKEKELGKWRVIGRAFVPVQDIERVIQQKNGKNYSGPESLG